MNKKDKIIRKKNGNLFCKGMKVPSEKYCTNYDAIFRKNMAKEWMNKVVRKMSKKMAEKVDKEIFNIIKNESDKDETMSST